MKFQFSFLVALVCTRANNSSPPSTKQAAFATVSSEIEVYIEEIFIINAFNSAIASSFEYYTSARHLLLYTFIGFSISRQKCHFEVDKDLGYELLFEISRATKSLSVRVPSLADLFYKSGHNLATKGWRRWRWRVRESSLVPVVGKGKKRESRRESRRISWSKLNYWVVLAALTFGNEPLNLEEKRWRCSKLRFRGGNHASFAKYDLLSQGRVSLAVTQNRESRPMDEELERKHWIIFIYITQVYVKLIDRLVVPRT